MIKLGLDNMAELEPKSKPVEKDPVGGKKKEGEKKRKQERSKKFESSLKRLFGIKEKDPDKEDQEEVGNLFKAVRGDHQKQAELKKIMRSIIEEGYSRAQVLKKYDKELPPELAQATEHLEKIIADLAEYELLEEEFELKEEITELRQGIEEDIQSSDEEIEEPPLQVEIEELELKKDRTKGNLDLETAKLAKVVLGPKIKREDEELVSQMVLESVEEVLSDQVEIKKQEVEEERELDKNYNEIGRQIIERSEDRQKSEREIDEMRGEFEDLKSKKGVAQLGNQIIQLATETGVDEDGHRKKVEELIEKSEKAGVTEEDIKKVMQIGFRLSKLLGKEDHPYVRGVKHLIDERRELLAKQKLKEEGLERKERERDEKRDEGRRRFRKEAKGALDGILNEEDVEDEVKEDILGGVEEIESFSDVTRKIQGLEIELLGVVEDAEISGEALDQDRVDRLSRKINIYKRVQEEFVPGDENEFKRELRKITVDNPELRGTVEIIDSRFEGMKRLFEIVEGQIRQGQPGFERQYADFMERLGEITEEFQGLDSDAPPSREGIIDYYISREVDKMTGSLTEAIQDKVIAVKGDEDEQERLLRKWFEGLMFLGESPETIYYSSIWNQMLNFLQREDLAPHIRTEFRSRMELLRFSSEMSSPGAGFDMFAERFPGRITPERISSLGKIKELRLAMDVIEEHAFDKNDEQEKATNIVAVKTPTKKKEAYEHLRKDLRKRIYEGLADDDSRKEDWNLEGKSEEEEEIILSRAENYIKEIYPLYFSLRAGELPKMSRDWWPYHRLQRYLERVTSSHIGNPPFRKAVLGPKIEYYDEEDEDWKPAYIKDKDGKVEKKQPVNLGLKSPIEFLIEGLGDVDTLRDAGFEVNDFGQREVLPIRQMEDKSQQVKMAVGGKVYDGCWVIKHREYKDMEIWVTTEMEDKKAQDGQKEKIVSVLNVVNLNPNLVFDMAENIPEGKLISYASSLRDVEKFRKVFEDEEAGFSWLPEGVDIKELTDEIYAAVAKISNTFGGHLPSISGELFEQREKLRSEADKLIDQAKGELDRKKAKEMKEKAENKRVKADNITEQNIRKPGVLYKEDWAKNFSQKLAELYLGRLDPEIHEKAPVVKWSPNIFASKVLRASLASGLVTPAQMVEIEQDIWGKDILGFRRRAIAERIDAIKLPWKGPFRGYMLSGWFFFILGQIFKPLTEEFEA